MLTKSALWLVRLSFGGLLFSASIVLLGHLGADEALSPFDSTISAYAAMDRMGPVEFGILVAGLASLALLAGMYAARIRVGGPLAASMGVGGAGFLIAALVPTVEPGTPFTAAAQVHRYAAILGCMAFMLAGLLLIRLATTEDWTDLRFPLQVLAIVSTTAGLAVTYAMFFGDRFLIGLYERILAGTIIATMALVATRLLRLPRHGHAAVRRR
ncbi:uncharacterized protein DUF998 [Stackebrandtia albiflava]|uniref:Uncharacterized protein DUF998 n=1 Tax=Stackebrandtia albiflava TaxID=406432 RepID=A0A562V245_9ACTN|nr:DUF998 domain-containing protein [Stackebrandtia albiflava]TWJ11903.1 uncharacterized protein DUF998 [Stackebrandtia albiflava]